MTIKYRALLFLLRFYEGKLCIMQDEAMKEQFKN